MTNNVSQRRLRGFAAFFVLVFAVLAGRLVYVHVLRPSTLDPEEDTMNRIARPARRGNILSADEKLLAWSEARVTIQVDPVLFGTNLGRIRPVAELLARELGGAEKGITIDGLVSSLTPRVEQRHWPVVATNRFEAVLDARQRPRIDAQGRPLLRPVLQTNWHARTFTNRAVVVFTNLPPADWHRIRTNLQALKFPEQIALQGELDRLKAVKPKLWRRLRAALGRESAPVVAWRERARELSRVRLEQRADLNEIRANGVTAQLVELRRYPLETLGAHILGYTTNDDRSPRLGVPNPILGASGVEHLLDLELTGSPGLLVTHRAKGRELVRLRERDVAAQDGLTAQLTLDTRLQAVVEEALDEGMAAITPKALMAIVVRPSTGEILALGVRPTYNPNRLREAPVDARWNRALTAPTEPGSTFKICTYATALELGRLTPDQRINCEGGTWNPGVGKSVNDVEGHGLGLVSAEVAFAKSSNVAAAKVGLSLTVEEFVGGMEKLGFLHRSGIFYRARPGNDGRELDDWGGENAGGIPALNGSGRIGTELHGRLSFGYGLYVTPLQTAFAVAALANDGVLMKPMLVRELRTPQGAVVKRFEPVIARTAVSARTAADMRRMMRLVVVAGTGKLAALADFEVAGKTGTAHKQFGGQQSADKYISTFVGMLPADKPELVVLVLADEPAKRGAGSYFGGKACGPIFTNIAARAASILALRPSAAPAPGEMDPPAPRAGRGTPLNVREVAAVPSGAALVPGRIEPVTEGPP